MTDMLTIRQPDDWHLHLRDGAMMQAVIGYTARQFARAIVMPNLSPPVTSSQQASEYRACILAAVPEGLNFTPLMTCYLTDSVDAKDLRQGFESGIFTAAKLYPANATTNSAHGVSNIDNLMPALEVMQDIGMPLLIHGEVTDGDIDIFDREAVFIDRILSSLVEKMPRLKVVFEHITTEQAVQFVLATGENVAATITPQHLHINRNAIFAGGIRPHAYCLPIAKRERHRLALRKAATSGSPKFFLGTDSAPHEVAAKESACGCAGIFNAPFALESYATVFEEEGALDKLEGFASVHGPNFYELPLNTGTVTLQRTPISVDDKLVLAGAELVPFHAGETINWQIAS
ncbi:dihydroorotase [Parasphingorhabdus sp. DH2-15]|uniref:dihydroorotase n=1 Tax=Parasphingorhabdus sp. DH2-15 TaxID=3444112 RepID=UPI003F686919